MKGAWLFFLMAACLFIALPAAGEIIFETEFTDLSKMIIPFHDPTDGNSDVSFATADDVPGGHGPEILRIQNVSGNPQDAGGVKVAIFFEESVSASDAVVTYLWKDTGSEALANGGDNDGSFFWRCQETTTLPISKGDQFAGNKVRGNFWIEHDYDGGDDWSGGFQLKMLLNEDDSERSGLWPGEDVTGGKEWTWDYAYPYSLRGSPFGIMSEWNPPPYWVYHRIWMQQDVVKCTYWSALIGDETIDMTTIADNTPGAYDTGIDGDGREYPGWVNPAEGWAIEAQDPLFLYYDSGFFAIGSWSGTSDWAWLAVETIPTAVQGTTWGAVKSLFK